MKRRESLGSSGVVPSTPSKTSKVAKRKISENTATTTHQINHTVTSAKKYEQANHFFFKVFRNPDLRAIILSFCNDTFDAFSLRLTHPYFTSAKSYFSNLDFINLSNMCLVSAEWFDNHQTRYSSIKRLNLCACQNLVKSISTNISWENLEELSLEGIRGLETSFYWRLTQQLHTIKRLNLNSTGVNFSNLLNLQNPADLELLYIYRCNLTEIELKKLIHTFPRLRALMLGGGTNDLPPSAIQRLAALTRLETLRLCQITTIADADFEILIQKLTNLQNMFLYHCPVKDHAVERFWLFSNLQWLCLWGSKIVLEKTLFHFVERAARLRYLQVVDCKLSSAQMLKQLKKARPDLQIEMI